MHFPRNVLLVVVALVRGSLALASVTGSINGTLKDPSRAVIAGATVTVTNQAQGIQTKTKTNENGMYTFPSLAVGRYDLHFEAEGFRSQDKRGLTIDIDSTLTEDATLELAQRADEVIVTENAVGVETASTQVGEVVNGTQLSTAPK